MTFGGPPAPDVFEMSLFGTGVGESLAVHVGHGDWFLVDSCRQNKNVLPAHLSYLQQIGVDLSEAVKLFVITHWHDDHIDGAIEVVRHCPKVKIAISSALTAQEFLKTLSIYNRKDYLLDRDKSGIRELGQILEVIRERRRSDRTIFPLEKTHSDHLLLRTPDCDVYALSPSNAAIEKSFQEFSLVFNQISDGGERLVFPSKNQNHNSIALWIQYKSQTILLGSDLEVTSDDETGWAAVPMNNLFSTKPQTAHLFKIPHHGSPNGDHESIWDILVSPENPILALTSYSRGKNPRPAKEDLERLLSRTTDLHCTSIPRRSPRHRDPAVERTMREVPKSRWAIGKNLGHIRVRGTGLDGNRFSVDHFGSAIHVTSTTTIP